MISQEYWDELFEEYQIYKCAVASKNQLKVFMLSMATARPTSTLAAEPAIFGDTTETAGTDARCRPPCVSRQSVAQETALSMWACKADR